MKARYFRCIDTKDWAGFATLFTEDARIDVTDDNGRMIEGGATFAAGVERALLGAVTIHHGHMPEIDVTSPTEATGIWAMEDWIRWPEGSPNATLHGWGHYHETYRVVDGEWRIATMRLSRIRRDVT